MPVIHGLRRYVFYIPPETGKVTLRGQYGRLHQTQPAPPASCNKFTPTDWSRKLGSDSTLENDHDQASCPSFTCSCGYYGYRTMKALLGDYGRYFDVVAHATCIGPTILCKEGWRTRQHRLDYIVDDGKTPDPIPVFDQHSFSAGMYGCYAPMPMVVRSLQSALHEATVGYHMNIPVLKPDDPDGCGVCQVVNGWVEVKDVEKLYLPCACRDLEQDQRHGTAMRVHRFREGQWVCTKCQRRKKGPAREVDSDV